MDPARSPHAKRGVLYQNHVKNFGRDDASVLVWQGSTTEMNANLVDDDVASDMYATDPDRAAAEFGAQFRSDVAAFITEEALQSATHTDARDMVVGFRPNDPVTFTSAHRVERQ